MSEALHFFLIQATLLSVVLVLHTYMGIHIIKRTLIFSDLVLDQLAAFGVMVGIGAGIQYGSALSYGFSFLFVALGAFLLAAVKPQSRLIPREGVIGILYALALAATLLLGDKLSGGSQQVFKTLTGSLVWVTWPLVLTTVGVYAALIVVHYRFRNRFLALLNADHGGKEALLWDFLFFATQGVITVLIVPIAGVLLAYAFLMIPAAIACLFFRNFLQAVLLGWSIGFAASMAGLFTSYYVNLPYSPTLILFMGIAFLAALIFRASSQSSTATEQEGAHS